jgi:hypothetical protein
MRKSLWVKLGKLTAAAAVFACFFTLFAPTAYADSVTYTIIITAGQDAGDVFTLVSPTGFLSLGTYSVPASPDPLVNQINFQQTLATLMVIDFEFNGAPFFSSANPIPITDLGSDGTYNFGGGVMTVGSTATPEPGTNILMLVGVIGLGFAMRKRIVQSRPKAS